MRAMKEAVPYETAALRRITLRSLAMGRIGPDDSEYIVSKLDEIDARVVSMREDTPSTRREF